MTLSGVSGKYPFNINTFPIDIHQTQNLNMPEVVVLNQQDLPHGAFHLKINDSTVSHYNIYVGSYSVLFVDHYGPSYYMKSIKIQHNQKVEVLFAYILILHSWWLYIYEF